MAIKSSTFEKQENKKKMIVVIKDFIRFPSADPEFRYETISHTLKALLEEGKLSKSHYAFFTRVMEVEYAICLNSTVEDQYYG